MTSENWWNLEDNFTELAHGGRHLLAHYPDPAQHIVCLGQSPAWIVKSAQMLSELRGEKREFEFLPFSLLTHSYYLSESSHKQSDKVYKKAPTSNSVEINIPHFRRYLQERKLDPKSLIDRYQETGKPIVFLDYVMGGSVIASFVAILFEWAKELGVADELKTSLQVHTYGDPLYPLHSISLPEIKITIPCTRTDIGCHHIMHTLSGTELSDHKDRIVPSYPPQAWEHAPPTAEGETTVIEQIETGLKKAVRKSQAQYLIDKRRGEHATEDGTSLQLTGKHGPNEYYR